MKRQKPRILVVDDHPMMRLGLCHFLAHENDFTVCGEAANGRDALSAVEQLQPALVLLDIVMRGASGLDILGDLLAAQPKLLVIIHSMHHESIFVERALRAGARGYVVKQETGTEILIAIRQVLNGDTYLSSSLRQPALPTLVVSTKGVLKKGMIPVGALTDREFEVFNLIGAGNPNKEIARQLHLSLKTVEAHREHIKRKLNLTGSTALNLMAVRWINRQAGN